MNNKNNYKLNYLSAAFYATYDSVRFPEIENKDSRPYIVVLVKVENNTFAVPFRTNVKHNNCYKFKTSTRPTNTVTGIDYTKAVIVNDSNYIGSAARINDKEYNELDANFHIILKEFSQYVKGYIKYMSGRKGEYNRQKYMFTTLKYFHKELGIEQ